MEEKTITVTCTGTDMALFNEFGKAIQWTIGRKYNLFIWPDENKIALEHDGGLYGSCIIGFPYAVLSIDFDYPEDEIKAIREYAGKYAKKKCEEVRF